MDSAPVFQISPREVVAVEHPMIINNVDEGLRTFGNGQSFERVLHVDDPEGCLPLYLRHNDPMCVPILSHNSPTNNVLLRITAPKRTGKRKRGSQGPYSAIVRTDGVEGSMEDASISCAHLLRTLRDNAGQYEVKAVAQVERTHRFRGLADFHHSTSHSVFASKLQEFVLPGEVQKMRQFKFDPSKGWNLNEEFLPPPAYTSHTLPFNWGYHQNPSLSLEVNHVTGETTLAHNESMIKARVDYVPADVESVPQSSPYDLPDDRGSREVIVKLREALKERPIWTRRALGNQINQKKLPVKITQVLHHVAYQFKGGPFRDAVIKYGVDPRTDKKYRQYQTVFFKIYEEASEGSLWKDVRTNIPLSKNSARQDTTTHIFDGQRMALDGKIWQLCDITDPLLRRLIDNATLRTEYESKSDGYFSNGSWAKIREIMRIKLVAIRAHFTFADTDFEEALKVPDVHGDNKKESHRIPVPVPKITSGESETLRLENGENAGLVRNRKCVRKLKTKSRDNRIDQGIIKTEKRIYRRIKPIPPQSLPGTRQKAKHDSQYGDKTTSQGQINENSVQNVEVAATIYNGQAEQRESNSPEYLTAEETADLGDVEEDMEDEDETEEGGLEDDDSDGRDLDEESEEGELCSGDEDEDDDEDGEDGEDGEAGPGMVFDEDEYDSATNVLDFSA